ncbi:uncharacterized protein LOC110914097 [Helianthus annuus]|uniref:uncharacterized protein LOC110914097 n=1 Tax=Helianthus annuus TaxID=4232 RepID=UPI000B8FFDEA|nr:uncharacterized protein LOC110914097 [Helianthus annuus]
MVDELPLWFPPMSSDESSDSSILFCFQNLIEEAELQDTGTSNRRRYIERQREEGHKTLMADYFVEDPKYNKDIFRHWFRMSKCLFLKIVAGVEENDSWYKRPSMREVGRALRRCKRVPRPIYARRSPISDCYARSGCISRLMVLACFCRSTGFSKRYQCATTISVIFKEQNGTAPKCPFYVNNHLYKRCYFLADGIYPPWSVFVKSIPYPHEVDEKKFKRQHDAARKDVERTFGVLKSKWGVLSRPMRATSVRNIRSVVYTCIILHNMILKDDGKAIAPVHIRDPLVEPALDDTVLGELMDENTHWRLKHDLINHLASQDLPHLLVDSDED